MSDTTATSEAATTEVTEQPADTGAETTQVTPGDVAARSGQEPTADNGQEPTTDQATTDTELPDWVRDKLAKANAEAAKYRTRAKDAESAKDSELDALKQQLGKALGLVEDDTQDPDKLIQAATAERDSMAQKLQEYQQKDAINSAASGKTSDVALLTALLQSDQAFAELDTTADDYSAQVAELVDAKITAHPALKAQAAASGVDTSTTNTGSNKQITEADLANMSSQEIYDANKAGKLNHLYGK
ncbi:hypothetical protein [Corynebacterium sp.]|uniref:hypothetical protein n=1 Tax=Corynebacterium sp. TaxID=1720 RepID=UPI0028B1EA9F|nr:hypothetical protein [Corynebacterium sp.]